ncbi:hypothetical protein GCM10022258_35970 [Aquimarina gracilis]
MPNQEIVLEFISVEPTSEEAQNVIAVVKKQLKSVGVEYTRISKDKKSGKLKIAYYSDADVESIKRILFEDQNVALDYIVFDQNNNGNNKSSDDKDSKDFNFDVYEIQKGLDFGSDFNDKYIVEVRQEREGYSIDNTFNVVCVTYDHKINGLVKVAQKVNATTIIAFDNSSYEIPEVRAGPIS